MHHGPHHLHPAGVRMGASLDVRARRRGTDPPPNALTLRATPRFTDRHERHNGPFVVVHVLPGRRWFEGCTYCVPGLLVSLICGGQGRNPALGQRGPIPRSPILLHLPLRSIVEGGEGELRRRRARLFCLPAVRERP